MSSPNLEGLYIKEATPSIAPSIYESVQYTRKWRIVLAIGLGCCVIGACVLGLYLSAKSRQRGPGLSLEAFLNDETPKEILENWRSNGKCRIIQRNACSQDDPNIPVFLLTFGGLRRDHVEKMPALKSLMNCGVSMDSLVPSYPSTTYPNLYSIATGLYPSSHGIVSDQMYDQTLHSNFSARSSNIDDWLTATPLWNSVIKQGKRSATYLWPGSESEINGEKPSYYRDEKLVFKIRLREVFRWLGLPNGERPQLIMMYYDEPWLTEQKFGPSSYKTDDELKEINSAVDEFMTSLDQMKMLGCVNLVFTSTHGASETVCENPIYLDDLVPNIHRIPARVFKGSVGRIQFTADADTETQARVWRKLQCKDKRLKALRKNQRPARYHYSSNPRIGEILLDTKPGSLLTDQDNPPCQEGVAGFDILEKEMQGIFIGHGPSFKNGLHAKSFRNVEIYNLINQLLKIESSTNNGTEGSMSHLLKEASGMHNAVTKIDSRMEFLTDHVKGRLRRVTDAVLGVIGRDEDRLKDCKCDENFETTTVSTTQSPTTTPSTTSTTTTTTTPATTTTSTTTTSTTTTPTTTTTTATPSTTSASTEKITTPQSTTTTATAKSSTSSTTTTTPLPVTLPPSENEEVTIASKNPTVELEISPGGSKVEIQNHVEDGSLSETSSVPPPVITDKSVLYELLNETDVNTDATTDVTTEDINRRVKRMSKDVQYFEDDEDSVSRLTKEHCRFGCPKYLADEVKSDIVNILLQSHYIIGFPESLNLPIWVSFSLTKEKVKEIANSKPRIPEGVNIRPEDIKKEDPLGCWSADERLSRSPSDQCGRTLQMDLYRRHNIKLKMLFPEDLELPSILTSEGFRLSNLAPVGSGFASGGRDSMVKLIEAVAFNHSLVNVVHGPIFDYDYDGIKDDTIVTRDTVKPLVPSAYFALLYSCIPNDGVQSSSSYVCPDDRVSLLSFVFPNTNDDEMCFMNSFEYLSYHLSTLKDIEMLTGLRIFPTMNSARHAQMCAVQPTQIPFAI